MVNLEKAQEWLNLRALHGPDHAGLCRSGQGTEKGQKATGGRVLLEGWGHDDQNGSVKATLV